ncbi:MAG: methyltransferase [Pseudohongiellaceae bacterium]
MYDEPIASRSMMERGTVLHEVRLDHVLHRIRASGARRVLDLGCGSGQLLHRLAIEEQFEEIVGLESSPMALMEARQLLASHPQAPFPRVTLLNGSYTEPQPSLQGYDAAAMVETIEHIKPELLSAVERVVFAQMRPGVIFMTTPNREYNPLFDLRPGEFREADHKFEWDRARFGQWARGVAWRNGYRVVMGGVGEEDPEFGAPTQTAYFSLQVPSRTIHSRIG